MEATTINKVELQGFLGRDAEVKTGSVDIVVDLNFQA